MRCNCIYTGEHHLETFFIFMLFSPKSIQIILTSVLDKYFKSQWKLKRRLTAIFQKNGLSNFSVATESKLFKNLGHSLSNIAKKNMLPFTSIGYI